MKITAVNPDSPLFGHIRPGYNLISVNGESVRDNIDCMYKLAEDIVELEIEDNTGYRQRFRFDYPEDIGLTFESDRIKRCRNTCIFCFIHQQPQGMRRSLYIKDDDYRLSFTHGNFISFSNITDNDISRIIEQRLSPLYISVHTTDDQLRRVMFGNRNLPPIMEQLRALTEKGIVFHTQVVICPGINDGIHLEKTINDLYSLCPGVATLGIVPVGLTRYRENLPQLRAFDAIGADLMIKYVHRRQREFFRRGGSRFVFAADEFYILAGHDFPGISEYEEMEQFENGIGMMRHFLTDFNRRKRFLKPGDRRYRLAILTGESAFTVLENRVKPDLKRKGFFADIIPIKNNFWGEKITVSGLLTGRDILKKAAQLRRNYDIAILPPNCLNNDNLFLDDLSLEGFRKESGLDIRTGKYSMIDTLNEVCQ
nr:DUF512 domain-containing protein [candidate division Zixibacteria bacterium]